jgi:hypothetical protein
MLRRSMLTLGLSCLALTAGVAGAGTCAAATSSATSSEYRSQAQPEATAVPTGARFTFSGSLRGTLVLAPNGCDGVKGQVAQFYFKGALAGMAKGPEVYSVAIVGTRPGGGTYTSPFPTPDGASVTLEASINLANYVWDGATGKFTIKAGKGSLAVGFVPDPKPAFAKPGHGRVHITGTWDCPTR